MFSVLSGAPFIHALAHWSKDAKGAARLLARARRHARDMGFNEVYANIAAEATPMLAPLMRHGFMPVQLILRGEI